MGLIYVNPEGPNGEPDPALAAKDIRETFGRMAMNDEETVALIAGGHSFGKTHGAADPADYLEREPAGATIADQSKGWKNNYETGFGPYTITSGLEGAWTKTPAKWSNDYLDHLFGFEWELTKSPAGAHQWKPKDGGGEGTVPDAHDASKRHAPFMLTTDIALRVDPNYAPIAKRFHENPEDFADAFARAWYKLTHRDMGPKERYLGPEVPQEELLWQDPVPDVDYELIVNGDVVSLKEKILSSGLSVSELVATAWASAFTYRDSDKRGGTNGGRLRLAPQKDWEVNNPKQLANVLQRLGEIQQDFNNQSGNKKVSMADLIVLAGCVGVGRAAKLAGHDISVPFTPGRADASQEQTDVVAFAPLEPAADGFRNYLASHHKASAEEMLIDKAQLLTLTAPELTVLFAGLKSININYDNSEVGVFTGKPGTLTNDYLVNLLDLGITWNSTSDEQAVFEGTNRKTGKKKNWTGTRADLIFGSNSELRAIAEVYACGDAKERFVKDFVAVWNKVMNLGRFDLA